MKTLHFLLLAAIGALLFCGCYPTKDGVDYAYEAYVNKRGECDSMGDTAQRKACRHIAAEQMAGTLENHLGKFGPPEERGNMMQMRLKDEDMEKKIEIPVAPYIPKAPQAGPTLDSLKEDLQLEKDKKKKAKKEEADKKVEDKAEDAKPESMNDKSVQGDK